MRLLLNTGDKNSTITQTRRIRDVLPQQKWFCKDSGCVHFGNFTVKRIRITKRDEHVSFDKLIHSGHITHSHQIMHDFAVSVMGAVTMSVASVQDVCVL